MDNKEQAFTQWGREHKSTIYSVCYMFSKDSDEIDDLSDQALEGVRFFPRGIRCPDLDLSCAAERGDRPVWDMDDRALQTKRLLKSCEDIILRLQMKEDDPQNN